MKSSWDFVGYDLVTGGIVFGFKTSLDWGMKVFPSIEGLENSVLTTFLITTLIKRPKW